MVKKRNSYRILVGKSKGKRRLERPRLRWADNIKMGLKEIGSSGRDCIDLGQDTDRWRALTYTVMNLRIP
jgi:hypothetical protein